MKKSPSLLRRLLARLFPSATRPPGAKTPPPVPPPLRTLRIRGNGRRRWQVIRLPNGSYRLRLDESAPSTPGPGWRSWARAGRINRKYVRVTIPGGESL